MTSLPGNPPPSVSPCSSEGPDRWEKPTSCKRFGGRDYDRIAYFDLERDPDVRAFFSNSLDPEKIIRNLSLYQGWTIEPARHLIVFDEVQTSNDALLSLKYFNEQANRYHIVAAGPPGRQAIPTPVFPRGQGELPRHVPAHLP